MHLENGRLTALLCKLKALSSWRQLVDQEKLHRQLLQAQQVSSRMFSTKKSNSSTQDGNESEADKMLNTGIIYYLQSLSLLSFFPQMYYVKKIKNVFILLPYIYHKSVVQTLFRKVNEGIKSNIFHVVQREITCRVEALRVKMTSEEEVVFLQEELETARKELSRCQAESSSTKKLLSRKVREVSSTLQLPEHEHPIWSKTHRYTFNVVAQCINTDY